MVSHILGTYRKTTNPHVLKEATKPHLFDAVIGTWSGSGAFLVPVAANGKVYVGSDHKLTVHGLK